jgi:hypothetical protein
MRAFQRLGINDLSAGAIMKTTLIVFVTLAVATYIWSASISDLENGTYVRVLSIFLAICAVISLLVVVISK